MKFSLAIACLCTAAFAQDASAASIVDAQYTPSNSNEFGIIIGQRLTLAQTFVVQTTGSMTNAMAYIRGPGSNTANAPLELQIRTINNGKPSEDVSGSNVLASAFVSASSLSDSLQWVNFDFTDFSVTTGQELAIVIRSNTTRGEYIWNGDFAWPSQNFGNTYPAGTYAAGRAFSEGASSGHGGLWGDVSLCNSGCNDSAKVDMSFRTFVNAVTPSVPEPSTWAMMLVGFGLIGATARYRRRATKVAYA